MNLLGEVEGTSWGFVGSAELGILTQLAVHCPAEGVGKFGGRLVTCMYCRVSTIDFINFSLASQSSTNLFFLGS
jgi:hypothetical protein